MQKKSSNLIAFVFIPLVAVVLAALCTFVWWVGKQFYKPTPVPAAHEPAPATVPVQTQAPVVPYAEPEVADEFPPLPPEVQDDPAFEEVPTPPEICPAPAVPTKLSKPRRKQTATPFEQGLKACQRGGTFPCAWENASRGVITQYWLMSAQGPLERGIYDKGGNLLSETQATLSGTVTSYTTQNTTYYFEGGVLVKIRTSPYDNCNFHDWFFINERGEQDVCQCVYNQADCCARSPYTAGGPRRYCDINSHDKDFCK